MLSLAIGREGQNARLAARLTGWRIDIRSDVSVAEARAAAEQTEAEAASDLAEVAAAPSDSYGSGDATPAVPAPPSRSEPPRRRRPTMPSAATDPVAAPADGMPSPRRMVSRPLPSRSEPPRRRLPRRPTTTWTRHRTERQTPRTARKPHPPRRWRRSRGSTPARPRPHAGSRPGRASHVARSVPNAISSYRPHPGRARSCSTRRDASPGEAPTSARHRLSIHRHHQGRPEPGAQDPAPGGIPRGGRCRSHPHAYRPRRSPWQGVGAAPAAGAGPASHRVDRRRLRRRVQTIDPRERGAIELPGTITVKELAELLASTRGYHPRADQERHLRDDQPARSTATPRRWSPGSSATRSPRRSQRRRTGPDPRRR